MSSRYFATARREILPHLPARMGRLLDLGCGEGATTALLRSRGAVAWAGGVELMPEAARAAEAVCDRVWTGNIEALRIEDEIPAASLDLVLALDVLEHLVDPWDVVRRLSVLLAPGGRLIVSVPNIRNWKFVWRLLVHGDFRYRDAGLLDRTHLRFFVRETAAELATCGGLRLVSAGNAHPFAGADARRLLSLATAGGLDAILAKQILVVAQRMA